MVLCAYREGPYARLMMQVLHCFCLFVACLVVVDGASLRRGDVRGPSGVPAMRPPPHMLVDAIFGKGNGNTMVDKLQMAGPKAPVSTMQQKADTFLFGTVRKWRKEEGEKAKEKEKELKLHPPMNKGLKQFYNAVAKQHSHTGPDFSGFEKRIEDERAGREKHKHDLQVREETAKAKFLVKAGGAKSVKSEVAKIEAEKANTAIDKNRTVMPVPTKTVPTPKTAFSFQGSGVVQRKTNLAAEDPPPGKYILPERKVQNTPDEGKIPNAKSIDNVNKEFRDIENTVNAKPADPKKDSGSGKESPIGQWNKWWDIRNWKHSTLERMTNSEWNGEAQEDDRGERSATNPKREPSFIKALDSFSNMAAKDDYIAFHKKDRKYGFAGGILGRPVEFNVQGMPQWTRRETWKSTDPRNGVMYGKGLKPCFHNCDFDDPSGQVDNLPNAKEIFKSPFSKGRAAAAIQAAGIVEASPEPTFNLLLNNMPK